MTITTSDIEMTPYQDLPPLSEKTEAVYDPPSLLELEELLFNAPLELGANLEAVSRAMLHVAVCEQNLLRAEQDREHIISRTESALGRTKAEQYLLAREELAGTKPTEATLEAHVLTSQLVHVGYLELRHARFEEHTGVEAAKKALINAQHHLRVAKNRLEVTRAKTTLLPVIARVMLARVTQHLELGEEL